MNTVAWNPLIGIPLHRAARAAINLTDALKDIWPDTWGERLASFLRNGFQLLIEHGHATLRDLPRIYYDKDHRERFTSRIKDPALNEFWNGEYNSYDDRQRREAQGPILNRIGQFLGDPGNPLRRLAPLLDAQAPNGDRQQLHRHRQSLERHHRPHAELHLRIAPRVVDKDGALVARGCSGRAPRTAPVLRRRISQLRNNRLGRNALRMRKYGLQLTLAHQFADQLHPLVLSAVLGNVDTMMIFRVGIDDAERLHRNFTRNNQPLNPAELAEQQPFHAFLKRGLEHYRIETAPAFPSRDRYDANVRSSLRRFGA